MFYYGLTDLRLLGFLDPNTRIICVGSGAVRSTCHFNLRIDSLFLWLEINFSLMMCDGVSFFEQMLLAI